MELLVGSRIALTPRPVSRLEAALDTAMLGHCPGRVRPERLQVLDATLEEMRAAGFGLAVEAVLQGLDTDLYHLPIPLHSNAEFRDIFPDAHQKATSYGSVLAGDQAWLAQAVEDFFANGGERLWVVRIPEAQGADGFLPVDGTVLYDLSTLRGLATVLVVATLAVVAFPDLERLQIPARVPDLPPIRFDNPAPCFLPCSQELTEDRQERDATEAAPEAAAPRHLGSLLPAILDLVTRHRPDVACLFTLPLAHSGEFGSPVVDNQALAWIDAVRTSEEAPILRQVQFLFPYLRGPRFALRSPAGLVAGLQAAVARRSGPWCSMAARPMVTDAMPYPRLSLAQVLKLREDPGVGVLQVRNGRISLDDERLAVPALHADEYVGSHNPARFDGFRSAEVQRFLGFLRRQLQSLGETLVFNLDYRDPRPRFALEQFFRRLYASGALRGALPEDAFQITESHTQEGVMAYEIMVAPAFPIDRLYLTFSNQSGAWQAEVSGD